MARPETGSGEAREKARLRRRYWVIGGLFAAGLFSGFYVGKMEAEALFAGGTAIWSPTLSLVLAGIYLVAILGGSLLLNSSLDELDRDRSYKAVSVAGAVYILLYPLWFLLWKGGFVVEPIHWVLFLAFWLSLALASLWYRFR